MINLRKGENISLTKTASGCKKFRLLLNWDSRADVDAIALELTDRLNNGGMIVSEDHIAAYFNNDRSRSNYDKITFRNPDGTIGFCSIDQACKSYGDNRSGIDKENQIADEVIDVDLTKVDPSVRSILLLVTIYDDSPSFNFGLVNNCTVSILAEGSDIPIVAFELSEDMSSARNVKFAEIYLRTLPDGTTEWKFQALGEGSSDDLASELRKYGVPC